MDNPDLTLGVQFFIEPVENPAKTRSEGRPIFDDREFIRIAFPGDNKRELVAPANEMHYVAHERRQMTYAERFAKAYEAFRAGEESFVSGTPLVHVPFLTRSKVAELKALKISSVEQLAGLPDASIKKIGMGGRDLVDQAKAYLDVSKGTAQVAELQRQIEELKAGMVRKDEKPDPYDGFENEDLENMIVDAGGNLPDRKTRKALIAVLDSMAKEKA